MSWKKFVSNQKHQTNGEFPMLRRLSFITLTCAAAVALALPVQAHKTGKKHTHTPPKPAPTAYLGDTCKPRVIETGAARPSETWAKSTALKAWKRKTLLAYGELYTDINNGKEVVWRCAKAGVSGLTTRCEVAATPCRAAP
jgi:hypothetical protein